MAIPVKYSKKAWQCVQGGGFVSIVSSNGTIADLRVNHVCSYSMQEADPKLIADGELMAAAPELADFALSVLSKHAAPYLFKEQPCNCENCRFLRPVLRRAGLLEDTP